MANNNPAPPTDQATKSPSAFQPIRACAIDNVAMASLRSRRHEDVCCNICQNTIKGSPAATGLMMWHRGDQVRYDEPPLCGSCSSAMSVTLYARWAAHQH